MVLVTITNVIAYFVQSSKSNSTIMKILAAFYVIGCGLRTILPRIDVERVCFIDSWLSCTFIGRCFATVAELSFMLQLCITLHQLAGDIGKRAPNASQNVISRIQAFSIIAFLANICAQCFCWLGVTTTKQVWHVFEESIWASTIFIMTICSFILIKYFKTIQILPNEIELAKNCNTYLKASLFGGPIYVLYMLLVDIPMYYRRFVADELRGAHYFTFLEGVEDAKTCKIVTQEFTTWKEDMSWITLYFSVAVWASIWLIRSPRLLPDVSKKIK